MCHWRYEIHLNDDWDAELAAFPFSGGVRPVPEARELVLRRVRRQVAGYVNAHPEARADIRIVEMSCNGPQRTIYPYRQGTQGGELWLEIGGWEFLPGEEEKLPLADLPAAPKTAPPGPAARPSGLAASSTDLEDDLAEAEEAVVVIRDGKRVATFKNAEEARAVIAGWSKSQGVVAHLVDLHGETLERVWPVPVPGVDPRLLRGLAPLTERLDDLTPVTARDREFPAANEFLKPERDGFERVRDHFESFLHYPKEIEEALGRLKTWARITSQDIEGDSRANDEQVAIRASMLYSLRHALRELEAAEGRLLVGRDDSWAPYATTVVSTFAETKAEVEQLEMQGYKPAVYTIERGQAGERLYPVSETPYTVWSMGTANLIAEFASADEAIACVKEDPNDLVAFLEEDSRVTVIYDPNGLTALSVSERRERLKTLGRWPASPADPATPVDAEEER